MCERMYLPSSVGVKRYSSSSSRTDKHEEPPRCSLFEMMMLTAMIFFFGVCVRVATRVPCGCGGMGIPCGVFGNSVKAKRWAETKNGTIIFVRILRRDQNQPTRGHHRHPT